MRTAILLAAGVFVVGCQPKTEEKPSPSTPTAQASTPPASGGIAPMTTPVAGGLTPVAGAENVGGGSGGGVGDAAKAMARRAASTPTAPSVPGD